MNSSEKFALVESVFAQAIALKPNDREAFIQEALKDDPVLIAQLKKMLHFAENQNDSVENAVKHVADQVAKDEQDKSGQIIDRFKLIKKLGQGGMGEVYLANRVDEEFQQEVAIKIIRSDIYHSQVNNLFVKERQILADLNHPNICRLFDGGTTEQGQTFLVMEYIDGVPLNQYCIENKLTYRDKAKLFLKVCSAVEAAHQKLIIHCDLKPTNIIVTPDGEPKLLDFGIAKLLTTEQESLDAVSDTAVTYNYASPEQLRGERPNLSSDVFSLGVVFSEMISGESFYRLNKTTIGKIENYRQNKTQTIPKDNLYEAIANIATPITESPLRWICEKASHFDSPSRYQTVEALKTDVQRYLDKFPVKAKKHSFISVFIYRVRRRKVAAVVLMILIATLISWAYRETEMRRSAEAELDRTEQVVQFLVGLFKGADPERNAGKHYTAKELLDRGNLVIESELKDDVHTSIPIMRSIADAYQGLGEYEKAQHLLHKILKTQNKIDPNNLKILALIYRSLGNNYESLGQYLAAGKWYKKSIANLEQFEDETELKSLLLVHSAHLSFRLGHYEEALDYYQRELDSFQKPPYKAKDRDYIGLLTSKASVLQKVGDYESSRKLYKLILQEHERIIGNQRDQYYSIIVSNYVSLLAEMGASDDDIENRIIEVIKINQERYPGSHKANIYTQNNLGLYYMSNGRVKKAEPVYLNLIKTLDADNKSGILIYMYALQNLGTIYLRSEQFEKAIIWTEKALKTAEKIYPEGHNNNGKILITLGLAFLSIHDLDKADIYLKQALKISERENYPDEWKSKTFQSLSSFYIEKQDFVSAEKWLQRSSDIQKSSVRTRTLDKISLTYGQAKLSLAKGQLDSALALVNNAIDKTNQLNLENRMYISRFQMLKAEILIGLRKTAEAAPLLNTANKYFSATFSPESKSMKEITSLLENIKH